MGKIGLSTTLSFLSAVQDDLVAVENLMRAQASGYHDDLGAALDLLVAAGGKRVRPALTLLAGKMLGASRQRLVTIAAAIELLHTATLVHDDLIDGALLRRGHPTLNSKWSPGATVLTGDFLFAAAAKLAADADSIPVMHLFARTLTVIVNGEITQLFASQCQANHENYHQRIYAKTASLFETSAGSAALLVDNPNEEVVDQLRCYGREIGIAFQIMDDILDFTGDAATVGKPVGNDLRQGLITLPALYYLEEHPDNFLVKRLLEGECPEPEQVGPLIEAIRSSTAVERAHQEAHRHVEKGLAALYTQPTSAERQSLEQLAQYITRRDR